MAVAIADNFWKVLYLWLDTLVSQSIFRGGIMTLIGNVRHEPVKP